MNSVKLKRLTNMLRKSGKRTIAENIVRDTAVILKGLGYSNPYKTREKAIDKIKPFVELRTQKKSGQSVQVPRAMLPSRQEGMAIRFLKEASLRRKERASNHNRAYHRAQEIKSIITDQGSLAINKRDGLHRMAISQRSARRF